MLAYNGSSKGASRSGSPAIIQHKCNNCENQRKRYLDKTDTSQIQKQPISDEDQEKKATPAPAITSPGKKSFNEPIGLSRKDFLKNPGTKKQMLGLTIPIYASVIAPKVQPIKKVKGWTFEPTHTSMGELTSIYTLAGSYFQGKKRTHSIGCNENKQKRYPLKWTIAPQDAAKIKEAEQEHCDDYRYAFKILLERYANLVNEAAGKTYFGSKKEAWGYITENISPHPAYWMGEFRTLVNKTKLRDENGWHTTDPKLSLPSPQTNCEYAEVSLGPDSFKDIGKHPSDSIIK